MQRYIDLQPKRDRFQKSIYLTIKILKQADTLMKALPDLLGTNFQLTCLFQVDTDNRQ